MKRVFIIRHAKSSWAQAGLMDFKRPLNDRGKRDAPLMAKRFSFDVDKIFTSTAIRALETAKIFQKEINIDLESYDELYHAPPNVYESFLKNLDNDLDSIILVGHNPGLALLVDQIQKDLCFLKLPTCAVVGLEFKVKKWKKIGQAKLICFDYPKKIIGPL